MTNQDEATHGQHIAVVIVNYRTPELACRAIDSLNAEREFLPNLKAVVIDNCSPDDSFKKIETHISEKNMGDWAKAILAEKNGGYAYGNNLGFQYFLEDSADQPDFFWLLNPDTYLRSGAGVKLVEYIAKHGPCIVGSRLEDEDGTPQVSSFNFPTWKSETLSGFSLGLLDNMFSKHRVVRNIVDHVEQVDWVAGASLMIPWEVFEKVGKMDDEYFLYFEEVDYCLQIHRAGYPCWYVPESKVVHEVGASTGISDTRKQQPRRPQYWFDSRTRYFSKNYGSFRKLLADIGWLAGYSSWYARKRVTNKSEVQLQPPKLIRDFLKNSVLNPF